MKVKSRKGSILAEACLIFPLVIGTVMVILYIVIALFLSLRTQTDLHMDLREESGRISGTVHRTERVINADFEREFAILHSVLQAKQVRKYKGNSLVLKEMEKTEEGRVYIVDEAVLLRRVALAKEILL